MASQGRIEQLVNMQVQRTRANPTQDQRESPNLAELSEIIRCGKGEDVLRAIKDHFMNSENVDIQTAGLATLHQCVLAGGPEIAVMLSAEKWTERFFRTAKETHSIQLRDKIMLQVVSWNDSYHTRGFQELVTRLSNSKVLGDGFRRLYATSRSNRSSATTASTYQDPSASPSSVSRGVTSPPRLPNHPPPSGGASPPPRAGGAGGSTRRGAGTLSNMEAFLLEAQGDLASLEYGLEHPDMLNQDIVADCKRHKARISSALHRNPDLGEDVSQPLISLLEQLGVAINLYSVIFGGEVEEEDAREGEEDTDGLSEEAIQMREAMRQSREMASTSRAGSSALIGGDGALSSSSAGISTSVLAGEQEAIQKLIDAERKEAEDLRRELDEARKGKDELQAKYKEAKDKNKKLVSLVEEYGTKIDELETTSASTTTAAAASGVGAGAAAGELDARCAAAERDAAEHKRKAAEAIASAEAAKKAALTARPKVSKKTMDDIRAQIKGCREGLRELRERSIKDMSKEVSLNSAKIQGLMAQIVTASEKDRKGDVKALQGLQDLYKKEVKLRKQYYNTIQDLKGNIRVYCRVRPMSDKELKDGHTIAVDCPATDELVIQDERGKKTYEFDSVFSPETTQEKVFEDTAPLIDSVVDGYNVCIFAYGQTGSGKTHSMMGGTGESMGINKRALNRLFSIIDERKETETSTVSISVLEVYCEQIIDLLAPRNVAAKTSYDVKLGGPFGNYVTNLKEVEVTGPDQIESVLSGATKNRTEGMTDMNAHSSRSHMLLYVLIKTTNNHTGAQTYGKLSLVDLAGSERLAKSGVEGQKAKEAVAINKSLSALGDVIGGLSQGLKHIPFRNSTLTFLLQDSMQGQAKVLMFCCVSPASYNVSESNSSLLFASRARGVALGTVKKNTAH